VASESFSAPLPATTKVVGIRYAVGLEIADSTRRHGVPDEDMLHAYRNAVRSIPQPGEDRVVYVGLDRAGRDWLEIGVLGPIAASPALSTPTSAGIGSCAD
jgi:hypothetical protein